MSWKGRKREGRSLDDRIKEGWKVGKMEDVVERDEGRP